MLVCSSWFILVMHLFVFYRCSNEVHIDLDLSFYDAFVISINASFRGMYLSVLRRLLIFELSFYLTAVSDYRQSLQFQNLNEEKQNIQVEVHTGSLMAL